MCEEANALGTLRSVWKEVTVCKGKDTSVWCSSSPEVWAIDENAWKKMQEMKYFWTASGVRRVDQIRNDKVRMKFEKKIMSERVEMYLLIWFRRMERESEKRLTKMAYILEWKG